MIDWTGTTFECGCIQKIIIIYFFCATVFVVISYIIKHFFPNKDANTQR